MGLAARVTGVTVAFALLAGGGYVVGDIYDVVPGFVTLAPEPAPAAPFPIAPGAVLGADPVINLTGLDPDAPIPGVAGVRERTEAFLDKRDDIGKGVSLLVVDLETDEILAAHKPDTARIPASTVKLLVGTATVAGPGTTMTLDTRVVQGVPGEIVLVGGGDMLLAAGAGDPTLVNGHAGLADLAEQVATGLKSSGQTQVGVRVDESLFSGPKLSPSWYPGNVAGGYVAPVTPLAVNAGLREGAGTYSPRHTEPSLAAAADFIVSLKTNGIDVPSAASFGSAPAEAVELGRVKSAPLGDIVDYVLQTSDNTISEVLGRLVALDAGLPGSFDGARAAVLAAIGQLGVDVSGAVIADCSGLGDGSKLTPRMLVDVVDKLADPSQASLRQAAVGMPIAGLSGTLYERFLSSNARGLVRAKTGSLPKVTSLAGMAITKEGRLLGFAVMLDKVPDGGAWSARAHVDSYISSIVDCGC